MGRNSSDKKTNEKKQNMNTNKISAVLSDADQKAALLLIQNLTTLLPFLQGLTPEQKVGLNKAANARIPFIQQAYIYAQQHPEVLPGTLVLAEYGKDVTFLTAFQPVLAAMTSQQQIGTDTMMLAASEAYDQSLDVYNAFKRANRSGEYNAIIAALAAFFEGQGKKGGADGAKPAK
jgi:hypothetical protein